MALTEYQLSIVRLLTGRRKEAGESYIAGGVALNELLGKPRLSHDIDLFHDTTEALQKTWDADRKELLSNGYSVAPVREAPSFVEALISRSQEKVLIQWVRDSAYRFFPLIEHEVLGLTLHPIDLATNKALALAGRLEVRDWVDMISCHQSIQPFGYIAWAACGKDPGLNPDAILNDAARLHYSQIEIESLAYEGPAPDAAALMRAWKVAVNEGKQIVDHLPADRAGTCLLNRDGTLFRASPDNIPRFLQEEAIVFHRGAIGGVWPEIVR